MYRSLLLCCGLLLVGACNKAEKMSRPDEGEAAMAVEFLANSCLDSSSNSPYLIPLVPAEGTESGWLADWHPLVKDLVHDILEGKPSALIAQDFHLALIELIAEIISKALETISGIKVYVPHAFSANDGGLAAGQCVVGMHRFALFNQNNEKFGVFERD